MLPIQKNIQHIVERMHHAAESANRDPNSIKLLLATKTQSIEIINQAIQLGYGLIGENRAQEVLLKAPYLIKNPTAFMPRENHFIGHLQSNKIKSIFEFIDCFQSIDRISIAQRLNTICMQHQVKKHILVQVNTSYEASKSGVSPNELFTLLELIKPLDHLTIRGFMTLGLNQDDKTLVQKGFAELKKLQEKAFALDLIPQTATELSMGMSHDLEWAIQEGSTMIRVGSAIFGTRA